MIMDYEVVPSSSGRAATDDLLNWWNDNSDEVLKITIHDHLERITTEDNKYDVDRVIDSLSLAIKSGVANVISTRISDPSTD